MNRTPVHLEDRGQLAIVRFDRSEHLFASDLRSMTGLWEALDQVHIQAKHVALIRTPEDFLSPRLVDDFLREASSAPMDGTLAGGRIVPRIVAVADTSVKRVLTFLRSVRAMTVGVFEGEIDFDLMGFVLACKYRVCTSETRFVNHSLRRHAAPGAGTPWFLARLIGFAKARRLYLDEVSLTASEALDLGIVDRVCDPAELEMEAIEISERFAAHDRAALNSMMRAMDLVDLDFARYLEQTGAGA